MTEIANSRRTLYQATYAPIEIKEPPVAVRAWSKWTYFSSLAAMIGDFSAVRSTIRHKHSRAGDPAVRQQLNQALTDLNALEALVPKLRTPDALSSVHVFREISPETLIILGEAHLELEQERLATLLAADREISEAFAAAASRPPEPPSEASTAGFQLVRERLPHAPDLKVYRRIRMQPTATAGVRSDAIDVGAAAHADPTAADATLESRGGSVRVEEIVAMSFVESKGSLLKPVVPRLGELAAWALQQRIREPEATELLRLATALETTPKPLVLEEILTAKIDSAYQLVQGFKKNMKVEPIGLLHLERISFTPAGMERGELVHSVPLSPGEEVNLAHREWSNTSEEFEKLVTDYIDTYSEKGVVEKSELSEATSHQTQHSTAYNTGVTVSGGYGPVNVTSSFNYSVQSSASNSAQASQKHTQEATSKASSRAIQEHKVSFRTASAAGIEDQKIQKIKNLDQKNAMRVDYYQLIRKWRVDLERYGLRLTYDVTIPEPGADIVTRVLEIQQLEKKLTDEFRFDVTPDQVTRNNYLAKAAEFLASVEDPPEPTLLYPTHKEEYFADAGETDKWKFTSLDFDIDPKYRITAITKLQNIVNVDGGVLEWDVPAHEGAEELIGLSGKVGLVYSFRHVRTYFVWVVMTATLKDEAYKAWQLKTWSALRSAAETNFEANRQRDKDRLDYLKAQLENMDALTLRKIEREEVMKGVIRWLFGPTFRFVPQLPLQKDPDLGLALYGSDQQVGSDAVWNKMSAFGEFIKFVHNAIEWENMLYFLYPYFWTHPGEWSDRKYIRHPDATHQQFLKAGSARVVLTIRPGFENSFLAMMELADASPDALIQFMQQKNLAHPYVTIAEEMQNYAKTNYPGIPSANPSKHGGAWRQINTLSAALEKLYHDCGRYPTTAEGLEVLQTNTAHLSGWHGPYVSELPNDPWGHSYIYRSPGEHGGFDIMSDGADGREGGEGDDADVVSWAEGSVMASWMEYTPTSALDVTVNTPMAEIA